MDGLLRLFKEVPGETLAWAAIFTLIALGIIGDVIVKLVRNRKNKGL